MEERKKNRPPAWADRLLEWFSERHVLEEVQGDLYEVFHKRCKDRGVGKAKALFVLDVLRSVSFRTMDNPFRTKRWSAGMVANYFKSGWRSFLRYQSYSLINIFGLSIGFAAVLLLVLVIRYENSFDHFHQKADRIYRVGNRYAQGGYDDLIVTPQIPLMKQEYPEIVRASRFHGAEDIIGHGDVYVRSSYHVVDADFASMFDFRMVAGDLRQALASPNQIVLTRSKALELFGNASPIGKSVRLVNEKTEFTIAAIAEDPPRNSTLWFEALIPWTNAPSWLDIDQAGNWYNTFMVGYVELAPGASKEMLEEKLEVFKNTHFLEDRRATWHVLLLPLSEEHGRQAKNEGMLAILSIIAIAVLFVSSINFTNLTIAQAIKRMKEVGLRRILGSLRWHVAFQFLTEGFITCAIAMAVGMSTAWVVLPYINHYYDFGISLNAGHLRVLVPLIAAMFLLPAVCAGAGGSLVLSGLKPVNAVKGFVSHSVSGDYLRRILLVFQFATSIVLVIGTTLIWQQTDYMKSKDLRLDQANVVAMDAWPEFFKDPEKARNELLSLRDELAKETAIEHVSFVSGIPGEYDENYNGFRDASTPSGPGVSLRKVYVDHNFFDTFNMRMVAGRAFSPARKSDRFAVVINESAMRAFGWTDIENKEIIEGGGDRRYAVVGVVEDYYYQSLKRAIQPLVHLYVPDYVGRLAVRMRSGRIADGLRVLRNKWEALGAYEAFDYRFVDQSFDRLYKEQDRLTATASLFSFIAIVISGLGLFSITAYSIRLRRREVSIRKVLGASVTELVLKLSGRYGAMVLMAFALACPVSYYLGNRFLAAFAYRIEPSPLVFAGAGGAVFVIAMCIVACVSGRAAVENPVDALKEE